MHGAAPGVQSRSDEPDRVPVRSSLSPMILRQLARRRSARARRPGDGEADELASGGPGKVAVAGILFLVVALAAVLVALWPRGSGDDGGLVATGVPTTESPFTDWTEQASTSRPDRTSTTPGDTAPETTGTTGADGGESSTTAGADPAGGSSSTTADDSSSTTAGGPSSTRADGSSSTTAGEAAAPGSSAPPSSEGSPGSSAPPSSERSPRSSVPPSSEHSPGSSVPPPPTTDPPPSSTAPTTAPALGDPDEVATWDALARCETGGDWTANPGNGRYGGLRIRVEDWRDYGGRGYPHQHPRQTQITIARRLQADEGWDYWRGCARQLGYR